MDSHPHQWSGDEWQQYCEQLFVLRHPNSYARMPDDDGGDLGIEGYSTDGSGCAYQCYATEKLDLGERTAAQKRKIARDLRKVTVRAVEVQRHLGDIVIRRWILVVPVHDSKEVTAYARGKEMSMRQKNLPFLDPEFRIDVQTALTHFAAERAILEQAGAGLVRVSDVAAAPEEVERLEEDEPELTRKLAEKIDRLLAGQDRAKKDDLRDFMQRSSVEGSNLEDVLRVQHASVYESILRERAVEENDVKVEAALGVSGAPAYVVDVRKRFEERLRTQVKALGAFEANVLSHGAVADWLRRCPMDFPGG